MTLSPSDRLDAIEPRLDAMYGPRRLNADRDPVATLVGTILSQNTSDGNTARAFASLRANFPTWDAVVQAPTAAVVDAIRSGGLANRKAPRIQAALAEVHARYGGYTLNALAAMPLDEARDELLSIDGVGLKTASCVLLFSMGRPAMPVDTHVHRLAGRIGLVAPGTSANASHARLETLIGGDPDRIYRIHVELIAHGKTVCRAQRPLCEICEIRSFCDYAASRPGSRQT